MQDVRIPYQQKRMFGFVTFVYPETVKIILAKGNPHFVCDSRVLVKPYKEKGKIPDKYNDHTLYIGFLFYMLLASSYIRCYCCYLSNFRKQQQQQQQQQLERGEFSLCSSPSGLDSREPFDLQFGKQMIKQASSFFMFFSVTLS